MDIRPGLGDNEVMRRLTSLMSLLLACGPDSSATEGDPTTDTTSGATSDTAATATSDTPTSDTPTSDTPTSDTATSDAPTSTPPTSDTTTSTASTDATATTDATASTTSDASDTTDATTGTTETTGTTGADEVEYAAFFWAGGLDHIFVHRADFTHDRCTTLHFAWPGGGDPALMISAPNQWAAVNASVAPGTADCLAGLPMGESVAASGGLGAATWRQGPNEYCPPQIDLDLVLDFPPDLPWVPAQEVMLVTALPLQNCP